MDNLENIISTTLRDYNKYGTFNVPMIMMGDFNLTNEMDRPNEGFVDQLDHTSLNKHDQPKRKPRLLRDISLAKVGGEIQGRVKSKTLVKSWSKGNANGKIFNFVLRNTSGEMNIIVSGNAADDIFDKIAVGNCYKVNAFKVKSAYQQYRVTGHDCELQLTKLSRIIEITGEDLPKIQASITTLAEIIFKPVNATVDILAVIFDVRPPQTFNCRDGTNTEKQTVLVVDDTMKMVEIGLWSEFVGKLDNKEGEAVVLQNLQVRDFNEKRQLSTTTNTIFGEDKERPFLAGKIAVTIANRDRVLLIINWICDSSRTRAMAER
ncbi:replication factor A protein 1-like [Galendromus occidentalis]|uniref:Replication factor A protein 1-like n=1 Tax=Galendromus occidentalis TaxID=34638 RepID=A0AAJ6QNE9_9ACAR|nr:replication factor A protein 1-like [Galendromus occidentalis]